MSSSSDAPAPWDIAAARNLYNVHRWGAKYFDINEAGHVVAMPLQEAGIAVDITDVIEEAKGRGLKFPLLTRFQDILRVLRLGAAWQFLGLESLSDQRYPYSAEAATEVNVCMIRDQDLLRVLEANPAISLRVIQALNRELQRSNDMIRNLGLMNSNERIASLLLSLAPDESSPDTEIPLPLSRKDMAQLLGLTVETVSRVISQLMRDKVILAPAGKDYFRILDRERLRTASGTEH